MDANEAKTKLEAELAKAKEELEHLKTHLLQLVELAKQLKDIRQTQVASHSAYDDLVKKY